MMQLLPERGKKLWINRQIKKILRVNNLKEMTPGGLDGHRYLLSIDVGGANLYMLIIIGYYVKLDALILLN